MLIEGFNIAPHDVGDRAAPRREPISRERTRHAPDMIEQIALRQHDRDQQKLDHPAIGNERDHIVRHEPDTRGDRGHGQRADQPADQARPIAPLGPVELAIERRDRMSHQPHRMRQPARIADQPVERKRKQQDDGGRRPRDPVDGAKESRSVEPACQHGRTIA